MFVIPRISLKRFLVTFHNQLNKPVYSVEIEAIVSDLAFKVALAKLPDGVEYDKATVTELYKTAI